MVLGSGTKDKAMGTLYLLWPSQSPGLLKARLPEAQGGAGSSLPILVSHQAGPIMVPCIAAQRLGCPTVRVPHWLHFPIWKGFSTPLSCCPQSWYHGGWHLRWRRWADRELCKG